MPQPSPSSSSSAWTTTPPPGTTDFIYVNYDNDDEQHSASQNATELLAPTPVPPSFLAEPTPTVALASSVAMVTPAGQTATTASLTTAVITPSGMSPAAGQPASSFPPTSPKMAKDSGGEVSYSIVGLDTDGTRGPQSHFVPPVRERTQNKRIQQLLNEKLRRPGRRRKHGAL